MNNNDRAYNQGIGDPNSGINSGREYTREQIQRVAAEIPSIQMMSAVSKFKRGIFPWEETVRNDFTVANASIPLSLNVDSSYWWLIYGISTLMTTAATDFDSEIVDIRINTLTSMIGNPWPIQMIRQFTAKPVDFYLAVPPNATLITELQNGATAANTIAIHYHGIRLRADIGDKLLDIAMKEEIY